MQVKAVVLSEMINGTHYIILGIIQCSNLTIYFTVVKFILKLMVVQLVKIFPGCMINGDPLCL